MKNANIANIETSVSDLFKYWVKLTQPLHSLTETEGAVFAELLRMRHELSASIKSEEAINSVLFSVKIKGDMSSSLNMKSSSFNNYISLLKTKGVLLDEGINRRLIPKLEHDTSNFKLIFNFNING